MRALGAEAVEFSGGDAVEQVQELTGGIGVDRVVDAVGVDAEAPGSEVANAQQDEVLEDGRAAADDELWGPGSVPAQALDFAVQMVAKAGTIGIVGVYPPAARTFPIGAAMNANLTIKMGNCPHRRYIPELIRQVRIGAVDPSITMSQDEEIVGAVDAYESFDQRAPRAG